ncbi:MAG: CHAT domain-containing protein [Aureispira sp.]|nr:CHAT domain-containing protein [Aureispira sp.]
MVERPVILLTFANQQDAYLDKLKDESKRLNDVLSYHHDKGTIEVYREESTTIDDLGKAIDRFANRIVMYHYAGHADGERLYFEENAGNADGLASLLGNLPNLKLVFLNGCSTKDQVESLLNNGVKAVIATAVPIDDLKAVLFAESFYRAFANNATVEEAFQRAVSIIKTRYGGSFDATIVQKGTTPLFGDAEAMPWGLYANTGAEDILQWTIPSYFTSKVTRPEDVDYKVNHYLADIIEGMIDHDPKIEERAVTEDGEPVDDRDALALIIENFPWPIGVQIRLLATKDDDMDKPSVERIKQLVSTYVVSSQFLFYIMMSQMWDEKRNNSLAMQRFLVDMLYLNEREFNQFDYFKNFIEAIKLVQDSNTELFVSEFDGLYKEFEKHGDFYNAYEYLESLKSAINTERWDELNTNLTQKCADGEYHLSTLLYHLAFFVKYDLITIRDIHVVNYRHLETSFNHYIGRLNVKVTDLAVSRRPKPKAFSEYANNSSVVLTPNMQDPSVFLNLSPFIIDKNAFGQGMTEDRATEQQLFIYAHREKKEYKYFTTIHNIYRVQERRSDQLLTSEGSTGEAEDGRGSRRRRRRRREEHNIESTFEVLKRQFELFEKDMTIR